MKSVKKFVAMLLSLCMIFALSSTAFAAEPDDGPQCEPCDIVLPYDITQADHMVNGDTRGAKVPKEFYNLDKGDYSVDGTFDTTIYTSYYFRPNSTGEFWYNMVFAWDEPNFDAIATVECWDKTTGRLATTQTFEMPPRGHGNTGTLIATGGWHLYKLNPDHDYYFRFIKTMDTVHANVRGTISNKDWIDV